MERSEEDKLLTMIKALKEDLTTHERFRKSDRIKINKLESENEVYKKQVDFYERIINKLLDTTEY